MRIQELAGKNICILGYGKEGQAMALALEKYATGCEITIADHNDTIVVENPKYWKQVGTGWLENLNKFDVLIKSPGIPPRPELAEQSAKTTSPTQIFLDSIASSGATVIGITGSKGKSTTSSLIHAILTENQSQSFLIGNIGEPAINHIADAKPNTFFVQEMSSYQLMDLTVSPAIAVITSFFTEHLDYHGSLQAYLEAKKHITRFQKPEDHAFYNANDPRCKEIAHESRGKKIAFSTNDAPVSLEETKLKGEHNLSNIAAATLVCKLLRIPDAKIIEAIKNFVPLPHRLESYGVIDSIEWVNDSISTTPESAIAALDALGTRVQTMILGGQDRGYDFAPLINRLQTSNVKTVILMPDSGATIGTLIEKAKRKIQCIAAKDMNEAVTIAKEKTQNSLFARPQTGYARVGKNHSAPIVLLSPAAPSYGHFKNFEDRGDQFRKYIRS